MKTFSSLLTELRNVDPEELAKRVSRRYGKRKSYGTWEKVEKGGHIPLTSFNHRRTESVADKEWKVRKQFGSHEAFRAAHSTRNFKISELHATQPFVRTNDEDKLKHKIKETDPSHIRVVTHRGRHFVDDGHHAVIAAKMRGETEIQANHIDLDKY